MTKANRLLLAALLAIPMAVPRPARADGANLDNLRAVCADFQTSREQFRLPSATRLLWDTLRARFFPGALVRVNESSLAVPAAQRVRPRQPDQGGGDAANVIFSIDPPPSYLAELDAKARRYAELTRELLADLRTLRPIAQAPDAATCVARALRTGFDFDAFTARAKERGELEVVAQVREAQLADRTLFHALAHLRLRWQVVHVTEMMEVHRALLDPRVRNVVFLAHGESDGKMLDSRFNEYPRGFFGALAPGLRSISVFACHGEEIAKTYGLREALTEGPSEHATRMLFVSDGAKLGGLPELTPIAAFTRYLHRVDSALAWDESQPDPLAGPFEQSEPLCSLSFPGFDVVKGTFGFELNGRFVGALHEGEQDGPFSYPCGWADRARNIVTIHGLNALAPAQISSEGFAATAEGPGYRVADPELSHYHRDDGTYQGSKFEFAFERPSAAEWALTGP